MGLSFQVIEELYLIYGNEGLIKILFFFGCSILILVLLWVCVIDGRER